MMTDPFSLHAESGPEDEDMEYGEMDYDDDWDIDDEDDVPDEDDEEYDDWEEDAPWDDDSAFDDFGEDFFEDYDE